MRPDEVIVVNLSGRGDKDLFIVARELSRDAWLEFLESEVARMSEGARTTEEKP